MITIMLRSPIDFVSAKSPRKIDMAEMTVITLGFQTHGLGVQLGQIYPVGLSASTAFGGIYLLILETGIVGNQ